MDDRLRDEYLADVATTVRSVIEEAARAVGSESPERGELRYGSAWEPLLRLRGVLVTDQHREDFTAVVADLVSTLAHSFLVGLDGGTALSDEGQKVFLADRNGDEFADVLHERLYEHLDVDDAVRAALRRPESENAHQR